MTEAPWLDTMKGLYGIKEFPGPTSNPIILDFARFIGQKFPDQQNYANLYRDDDTAWCGLVLAYCMAKAGIRPPYGPTDVTRFFWAHSWTGFGTKLAKAKVGAVLVLRRPGGYHVAICDGETDTHFWIVGGNQGNTVSRIQWPKRDLIGAYWPSEAATVAVQQPSSLLIAQEAFDAIVREEVTGRATYEKKYMSPIWPGGGSGITIGIGYDVGAGPSSIEELRRDWRGKISDAMIDRLALGLHVTGQAAKNLLPMDSVVVPWDKAIDVFANTTLPKYYRMAANGLPNFEKLNPTCKGVLVSLVYNRGASFSRQHDPETDPTDRYREMRAIRSAMVHEDYAAIPSELRSMKRLWPNMAGLVNRRENEALMFERGLKSGATLTKVIVTTAVVVNGGNVANEAQKETPDYTWVAVVGMITIVAVVATIVIIKKFRK